MSRIVVDALDRCRSWRRVPCMDGGAVMRATSYAYDFGTLEAVAAFDAGPEGALRSVSLTFDGAWCMEYDFTAAFGPRVRLLRPEPGGVRCHGHVLTAMLPSNVPRGMCPRQWMHFMQMHPFVFKLPMFSGLVRPCATAPPLPSLVPLHV